MSPRAAVSRLLAVTGLVLWSIRQVLASAGQVIRDVLVPSDRIVPGIVVVPLHCRTDLEVTVFAGLISLTPGTLTVAVRSEPEELWVHGMYVSDAEAFRAELGSLQDRVLRALRAPHREAVDDEEVRR